MRAFLGLLAVGLLVVVALVGWSFRRYQQFEFVDVPGIESAPADQPTNWLLVGTDSREGVDPEDDDFIGDAGEVPGERADTIMVGRVDPDTKTIDLLSIPRDLWVPIVGADENRINSAFSAAGGRERLVLTIENYLGIHVNHYVEVNFAGFQQMVEALDGVPLWFDSPTRDSMSGLNIVDAGCHVLNGPQALSYARARHVERYIDGQWVADGTSDLGRTARQREFLARVASSASSQATVGGMLTMDRLVASAANNLVVDNNAGFRDLAQLAQSFADAQGGNFTTHSLPVTDWVTPSGAQVLLLQTEAAQPVLDMFRTPGEGLPQNGELSGDQTIPESKGGTVVVLSPQEMASTAVPGIGRDQCLTNQ
ncbi:MAG: LCP family protein [Acidimicrobiia bacterium]|nr:LCP family protein [Acidimicrobiia bacterium]